MAKATASKTKAPKAEKAKREPSPYNAFMKIEIAKVKKANPSIDHKEAFKKAASNWKTSTSNPNKGK